MGLGHEVEQHLPQKATEDLRGPPKVPEGDFQPGIQRPVTPQSSRAPATPGCPSSGSAHATVTCRSVGVASLGLPGCGEIEGTLGQTLRTGVMLKKKAKGCGHYTPWGDILRAPQRESSTFTNKATQSKFRF